MVIVQGIRGGAWTDVVTGGLDMIAAVAGMIGPAGAMLSTVLGIASMMFGMFGGATGTLIDVSWYLVDVFMHNVEKWRKILLKFYGVKTERFLKYIWPFLKILNEKVKMFKFLRRSSVLDFMIWKIFLY